MIFAGFLSLEEIDEAEYRLDIPKSCEQKPFTPKHTSDSNGSIEGETGENPEAVAEEKVKSKKKKKRRDKKKGSTENVQEVNDSNDGRLLLHLLSLREENSDFKLVKYGSSSKESVTWGDDYNVCFLTVNVEIDADDELLDDPKFEAWNKLRLHPLIMKSIHKLGFKEPTPIQEKCIPKAAHEGKVVSCQTDLLCCDLGPVV